MKMKTEPNIVWIPPSELSRRVETIPLPKKVKSTFTTIVTRWQSSAGTEWTVARLKAFRDCCAASYAHGSLVQKPEWFATTASGKLAGVFGTLHGLAMEGGSPLEAVLNLVNVYTGACYTSYTNTQLEEVKASIQQDPVRIPKRGHGRVGLTDVFKAFKSLPRISTASRRCGLPIPLTLVPPGKKGHAERIPEDVVALAGSPLYGQWATGAYTGDYRQWNRKLLCDAALGAENTLISSKFSTCVGSVGFAYEPGLKIRYFAFPNVVLQRAVEPLKDLLLRQLGRFPWDCTLDQRKADNAVATAMSNGRVVHTVDMSKATDSFPWSFQRAVGEMLTVPGDTSRDMLDLFSYIVEEGWWEMPDGSRVKWTKGQPLGLGPSFPLFTISHGILLYILNEYSWSEDFYVLGDDVIILNDDLAERYRKELQRWEVGVSEAKSFHSCRLGQFAGVTYTNEGQFHVPKWRPLTRDSILDLAAWWYPGLTKGLPDHDEIVRILGIPEPYGLGRNPDGKPLSDRFDEYLVEAILEREERRAAAAMPCATRVNLQRLHDVMSKIGGDSDELYPLLQLLKDAPVEMTEVSIPEGYRRSTDRPLKSTWLHHAMDGTEVGGYPRLRHASRVDPYTLGSLRSWKQLLKRSNELRQLRVGTT